jgi:hypothetical protein
MSLYAWCFRAAVTLTLLLGAGLGGGWKWERFLP